MLNTRPIWPTDRASHGLLAADGQGLGLPWAWFFHCEGLFGGISGHQSERRLALLRVKQVTTPCGCEVYGFAFCNYGYGVTGGDCEACSYHATAASCEQDSLPTMGVADCKARCMLLPPVHTSHPSSPNLMPY